MARAKGFLGVVQRYSLPLISGVLVGMIFANADPEGYAAWQQARPFGDWKLSGHSVDLTFLLNDVFMAFFFGLAAKEITDACLPGGVLSPPSKAILLCAKSSGLSVILLLHLEFLVQIR